MENENAVESQMLDSLELFHYANRFRRERFSIVLAPEVSLEPLKLDLRLLQAAGIQVSIFCSTSPALRQDIEAIGERGAQFCLLESADWQVGAEQHIPSGTVPIYLLPQSRSLEQILIEHQVFSISRELGATKTILVSSAHGLVIQDKLVSHPTLSDLEAIIESDKSTNIASNVLKLIQRELRDFGSEVILLGNSPGDLYQEIFTHRGCGTLFSNNYPNIIRPARLSDTHQIALLLRPTIQNGSVLPISEDQIAAEIEHYSVYTVNDEIIALAKLTFYGNSVELGKFATLPRYQGKGRAQELALFLLERARESHAKRVFALSTNPAMWRFFEKLGFEKIDREQLPKQWQEKYDFSRPSVALQMSLATR
jgi:N-acetylglutamate synthase-like GNAT family acetyltransferase